MTIAVVYVMSVTELSWREALTVVQASRTCASINAGFQRQLHEYQFKKVAEVSIASHLFDYLFITYFLIFLLVIIHKLFISYYYFVLLLWVYGG